MKSEVPLLMAPGPVEVDQKVYDVMSKRIMHHRTPPFGEVYHRAIAQKLDRGATDGLFVIEVSPIAIMVQANEDEAAGEFRENDLALDTLWSVNTWPNFQYLLFNYAEPYYNILLTRFEFL